MDVLGAVTRLEPDWTALPPATPPVIRTTRAAAVWRRTSDDESPTFPPPFS